MNNLWQKINQRKLYVGRRTIFGKTFVLPNGHVNEFEIIDEGKTVCVVAITLQHEFLVVEQFRPGPEKILQELPGGNVQSSENPFVAIERELLEETGYQGECKLLLKSYGSAYSSRERYNFLAINCKKIAEPILDTNEFIKVKLLSANEFKALIWSGELTDLEAGLAALIHLGMIS